MCRSLRCLAACPRRGVGICWAAAPAQALWLSGAWRAPGGQWPVCPGCKYPDLEDYLLLTSQAETVLALRSAPVQPQLLAVGSQLDGLLLSALPGVAWTGVTSLLGDA